MQVSACLPQAVILEQVVSSNNRLLIGYVLQEFHSTVYHGWRQDIVNEYAIRPYGISPNGNAATTPDASPTITAVPTS